MIQVILGVVCLGATLIYFILRQVHKKKVRTETSNILNNSEPLSEPCKVQVYLQMEAHIQKWQYVLSLNNDGMRCVNHGNTIEFFITHKKNSLVGFGRGYYGGYKNPAIDSPFIFDAVDGGNIKILCKPVWVDTSNSTWKSNFTILAPNVNFPQI
ncbi:MAG: hypothetical protein FWH17_10650 [Oscillospiraceae bacterium]|nr:hypothetical protein [Oscillospiraceae bacterium]